MCFTSHCARHSVTNIHLSNKDLELPNQCSKPLLPKLLGYFEFLNFVVALLIEVFFELIFLHSAANVFVPGQNVI